MVAVEKFDADALDWCFESRRASRQGAPWDELTPLGLQLRLPCAGWAMVEPSRIGELGFVAPQLARTLQYDYSFQDALAVLGWWHTRYGLATTDEQLAELLQDNPPTGDPCIRGLTQSESGHHEPSCTDIRRQLSAEEAAGDSKGRWDSFLGSNCDYFWTMGGTEYGRESDPLFSLMQTGWLFRLSQSEMRLYALIWSETERIHREQYPQPPTFGFVNIGNEVVHARANLTAVSATAASLVAHGLIETNRGSGRENVSEYRLVVPVPCPRSAGWQPPTNAEDDPMPATVVSEPVEEGARRWMAFDAVKALSTELSEEQLNKLAGVCISGETVAHRGIRYFAKRDVAELEQRLARLGVSELETRSWGLRSSKHLALADFPFFFISPSSVGDVVLAFKVAKGGASCASTEASTHNHFGVLPASPPNQFVICNDFVEALAVESAGFAALGLALRRLLNPPTVTANEKPWRGRRVLLLSKLKRPNSQEQLFLLRRSGAVHIELSASVSDYVEAGDLDGLRRALADGFESISH